MSAVKARKQEDGGNAGAFNKDQDTGVRNDRARRKAGCP